MSLGVMRNFSVLEYAESVQVEGGTVFRHEGIWWRKVRPFFYRPLLPYVRYESGLSAPAIAAAIGGYQYAVSAKDSANSMLQLLVFSEAESYSLGKINPKRRWEVRAAEKRYSVHCISNPNEFRDQAYDVYCSFYERTRYSHQRKRVVATHFAEWSEALYCNHCPLVLGVFSGQKLVAVSISRMVEDTLIYSSFFARSEDLRHHVASLMLHSIRALAAESGKVRNVFVGMRKTGAGRTVDDFYLHRGCSILPMPAHLKLNPIVRVFFERVCPQLFGQLAGRDP